MDLMRRIILFFGFFCVSFLHGQGLVLDTLVVPLHFSPIPIGLAIDSLRDERECHNPALLDYGEITRFVFIPIDQEILADRPVAQAIANAFKQNSSDSTNSVWLGLKHLDFLHEKHFLFYHRYHLYACVRMYSPDTDMPLAEWRYDCQRSRWIKGISLRERYQRLFQDFICQLGNDLNSSSGSISKNFRQIPWMQLFAYGEWTMIPNGYLLDGSVDFLFPEVHGSFLERSGVLRYRNEKRVESIAWALFSDSFFQRFNTHWLFRVNAQVFLGMNLWKDAKEKSHSLYDIPILDGSLALGFISSPKSGKGLCLA